MSGIIIAAPPTASVTTPLWVLIATIAIPFLGVLITALVTNRANSRQSSVSAREANTHEMDMILDGFKEGMAELRTSLKEQKDRSDTQINGLRNEVDTLKSQVILLQATNRGLMNQNTEQHNHIVALEDMIPDPPGIPRRPRWTRIPSDNDQDRERNDE